MKFKTWKKIKLGTGLKTGDDFRKALSKASCHIGFSGEADDIMDHSAFTVAPQETEVELVNVSVAELGLYIKRDGWNDRQTASLLETYARAQEFSLQICPNEVGPQLRLQYLDQPEGWDHHLTVGMTPIILKETEIFGFGGKKLDPFVFDLVKRDNKLWLFATKSEPNTTCFHTNRFIFLQANQKLQN